MEGKITRYDLLGMICWSEYRNLEESIHIFCCFGSLDDHRVFVLINGLQLWVYLGKQSCVSVLK